VRSCMGGGGLRDNDSRCCLFEKWLLAEKTGKHDCL